MQFPVPQFTDVEDRIIGALTLKQFGIIFAAGVVIFLAYTATKNLYVLIFFGVLFGVPALALAFGKINGRPLYKMIGFLLKFATQPKVLIFHKEANEFSGGEQVKPVAVTSQEVAAESKETTQDRLREVNRILQQRAAEEKELIKKL